MNKDFIVANSIKQAFLLKNSSYRFLSGGTEINRLNSNVSESSLISLKMLPLNNISQEECYVKIGATCTFQQILDSSFIPSYLKVACSFMSSRTRRNMATIGGNIANMRDDSYLIPTLVVANAKLEVQNSEFNSQIIDLFEYLNNVKAYSNALILNILLPKNDISIRSKRCSQTAQSHAYITLSVCRESDHYRVFACLKNVGFTELSNITLCLNRNVSVSLDQINMIVSENSEVNFLDDIYGSAVFKKYILGLSIYELYSELKGGVVN